MRYVLVPPPVAIVDRNNGNRPTGEIVNLSDLAFRVWLNDARAAETPVKIARWCRVVHAFDRAKEGDVLELEDADYATLIAIVREPHAALPALIAVQCLAFYDAIEKASTTHPRGAAAAVAEA